MNIKPIVKWTKNDWENHCRALTAGGCDAAYRIERINGLLRNTSQTEQFDAAFRTVQEVVLACMVCMASAYDTTPASLATMPKAVRAIRRNRPWDAVNELDKQLKDYYESDYYARGGLPPAVLP